MPFPKILKLILPAGIVQYRQKQSLLRLQAKSYSQWIKKGDLVYDVGANIGDRVRAFRSLGARVIAYEPQSRCIDSLKKDFVADSSVTIRHCGLGATPGELKMHIASVNTMSTFSQEFINDAKSSTRFQGVHWDNTETVSISTLDAEIRDFGEPAFIKIDVEGFEANVLAGLSTPIPCISFEWTPEREESTRSCIVRCLEIGMTEFNISFGEEMVLNFTDWVDQDTILCLTSLLSDNLTLFGDIYARKPASKSSQPSVGKQPGPTDG